MDSIPKVGSQDVSKKNSPIVDPEAAGSSPKPAAELCWFNGEQYGPGAEICSNGVRLRCYSTGNWATVGNC